MKAPFAPGLAAARPAQRLLREVRGHGASPRPPAAGGPQTRWISSRLVPGALNRACLRRSPDPRIARERRRAVQPIPPHGYPPVPR